MFNFYRTSNRIKKHEGFKNKIYKDLLGNLTIGYGHLIRNKDSFKPNTKYSKKILSLVFKKDLEKAIFHFKKNYRTKNIPTNIQEVIIEMIFQLGIKNVLDFKKFNTHIYNQKYFLASFEMVKSRWYSQTPKRADKLINFLLNKQ